MKLAKNSSPLEHRIQMQSSVSQEKEELEGVASALIEEMKKAPESGSFYFEFESFSVAF
ncbi:hypothetical protein ACPV4H_17105 [Vibrio rotiferianus]|uniref:hypothetical protein n=1 Tax=Vibrio rotiferianus TaxID=190895 RepID=UPI00406A0BB0